MFVMVILRKIFSIFVAIILSVSLSIGVLSFRASNTDTYKKSLEGTSFYSKADELVSGSSLDDVDYDKVLTFLIFDRVTESLVTKNWVEKQTDKNLKLYESWVSGESDELSFFIPYDELNSTVSQNINQDLLTFVEKNRSSVRVCNSARETAVQKTGYLKEDKFCVPISVRDGQKTFSNFVLGSSQEPILKKLYPDTIYKNTSGVFEAGELSGTANIADKLDSYRNLSLFFRENIILISIILLILVVLNFAIVYLQKKSLLVELEKQLLIISIFNLVAIGVSLLIIAFGGFIQEFVSSNIAQPFATDAVVSLFSTSIFQIILSLVFPLIFINLAILFIGLGVTITRRVGLFDSIKVKNQKLHKKINHGLAPSTLDGSFKSALKKENLLRSFGGNPLLHEYDKEKAKEKAAKNNPVTQAVNQPKANTQSPIKEPVVLEKTPEKQLPQSQSPKQLSSPEVLPLPSQPPKPVSQTETIPEIQVPIIPQTPPIEPAIPEPQSPQQNVYGRGGYSDPRVEPKQSAPTEKPQPKKPTIRGL